MSPDYTPFYCEENIWRLCAARAARGEKSTIVLISNPTRSVALWSQRAAPVGEPMAWDYHLILLAPAGERWEVWDLDTRLGAPRDFDEYAGLTFAEPGALPPRWEPRFRVIDGGEFLARFSSDRSHMRGPRGGWRRPPPTWPPIVVEGEPHFFAWLDEGGAGPGQWESLRRFAERFTSPSPE
jgi:hypothetical protein